MRNLVICILLILNTITVFPQRSAIRDIDLKVKLDSLGAAHVTEVWDITVSSGTEWYLVKSNMDDIRIENLQVKDETGKVYEDEGQWDVDRSIQQKSGKCGIVTKGRDDFEICWGVGSYGDHIFTVSYTLINFIKSMNDYDAFNYQFISPGLSSRPEHVKVTISKEETTFSYDDTRIAAFGFIGNINIVDGVVVAESSEQFVEESSLIIMIRFNKGIFAPTSIQDRDFAEMEETALKGSDYERDDVGLFEQLLKYLLFIAAFALVVLLVFFNSRYKKTLNVTGHKPKDITWCRDVPFKNDLFAANVTLKASGNLKPANAIISALILQWLQKGIIEVQQQETRRSKKVSVIVFDESKANMVEEGVSRKLYDIMKTASGIDVILQQTEFQNWAQSHYKEVFDWMKDVEKEGLNRLVNMGAIENHSRISSRTKYTPQGQDMAYRMLGFKKYLLDFSLINERQAVEVNMWDDYLVFASLFGIADKVSEEFKGLYPDYFIDTTLQGDRSNDLATLVIISNNMSSSFLRGANTGRVEAAEKAAKEWGGGGASSFGGGGGFSGGGFGGGSR